MELMTSGDGLKGNLEGQRFPSPEEVEEVCLANALAFLVDPISSSKKLLDSYWAPPHPLYHRIPIVALGTPAPSPFLDDYLAAISTG
jgi:hypothetical protein